MSAARSRMVGRSAELDRLAAALTAAAAGDSTTVIVSGEAGIGKTRLVEEVTARAAAAGFAVAAAGCSPMTAVELPFGPAVDLVADLSTQVDLKAAVSEQVWRGLAPLTGRLDGAGPPPDRDGTRLFLGFGALVSAVSKAGPVMLLVEDLHWADPTSVDLLTHLARRARRDRLLLVVTHRPIATSTGAWLRTAMAELLRHPATVEVQLGPLGDSEIADIIAEQGPSAGPERLAEMCRLAEGIPFFAVHLAHLGDRAVPVRLHDVLTSSLDGVEPAQRALLLLLAVFGDTGLGDELLVSATGAAADDFARHVRELRDRGLLVVRSGAVGFRHALLREVLIEDALPSEVRQAHEQICAALTGAGFGPQSSEAGRLAHHLLGCGRWDEALVCLIAAARQAWNARAFADAMVHYRSASALWARVDEPDVRTGVNRVHLACAAAAAARWAGEPTLGLALLDDVVQQLPPGGHDRARWQHVRGQIHSARGDVAGALTAQRSAAELLEPVPQDPLRPAVLAAIAHALMVSGRAADAERAAIGAAELAGALGAAGDRLHALITAGAAQAQLGRIDEAVDGLRRCVLMSRELDDLEGVTRSYGNLAFALGVAGRERELLQLTDDGIAECRRYGPVVSVASTLINNQVNALLALGDWDRARQVATEALTDTVADGPALHLHLRLADLAVAQGLSEETDRQLGSIGELAGTNPYALSALTMLTAERALWQDEPATAARLIDGAMPRLQDLDDPALTLGACWLGLRAAADLAEAELPRRSAAPSAAAADLLRTARAACVTAAVPTATAVLATCEGEFARIGGVDTVEQWTTAAAANRAIDHPYALAYCLLHLGTALLRTQARAAAARSLSEALLIAERLGARPLCDRIRLIGAVSALQLDPSTAPEPPPSGPASTGQASIGLGGGVRLTARERQVLALLVTGATNRRIGRQLFISERTAGVHVSNILGKLGVTNRTEAARMAVRLNLDTDSG